MAVVTEIPWGDGSGDKIYLTFNASQGDQTVLVSSDANVGTSERSKTLTFSASHNGKSDMKALTVVQEGVPEQYILFADPVVEQICATKWGDGVGLKPSQAAKVTDEQFGTTFRNTNITSFDELLYFTGLDKIPASAFYGCSGLEKVAIPENVNTISSQAFRGCSKLETITLTNSVTGTANNIFYQCTSISRINIPSLSTWLGCTWAQNGGPSFASSGIRLYINDAEVTEVRIPNSFTEIKTTAFRRCIGITSVVFHDRVTNIGSYAFQYCSSLQSIDLPLSVTTIGSSCFQYVASSGSKATYIIRAATPPTLGNNYCFTANNVQKIYVPQGALSLYQSAQYWSAHSNKMAELDASGNIPI